MWCHLPNQMVLRQLNATTLLRVVVWTGIACLATAVALAGGFAASGAKPQLATSDWAGEPITLGGGETVAEAVGLGVSVQQILGVVNMATSFESDSPPLPCFLHFQSEGEVRCYKDQSDECYLVFTGNPEDVELVSIWVTVDRKRPDSSDGCRKYDIFDQVVQRTVVAIDPTLGDEVRRWAVTSIPHAMHSPAGTWANWGRWMTKLKFDGGGDKRYLTFLIGLPLDEHSSAPQTAFAVR